MKWENKLSGLVDHIKGFVLAAFLIIALLAIVLAYRYYEYRQEDPNFCVSCHPMKEAYKEWQKGKHRDIICQQCHHVSMVEQNQLLIAFVMKQTGQSFSQSHGREKPWLECRKCHMDHVAQGSLSLQKSYGHAKHVFMQSIECKVCHKGTLHDFKPNESACIGCHKEKGVHGIGMEAFSCLKCHSYSEKTASMIPKDRCIKCHPSASVRGPMSGILCHQCHKPHGKIIPALALCTTECHSNESTVGQHGLHMKKGLNCLDCHKAHTWVVGEKRAQTLCSRCHVYKSPRLFIY